MINSWSFLEPTHKFYPDIQIFNKQLEKHHLFQKVTPRLKDNNLTLRKLMKVKLEMSGKLKLKRLYTSFQFHERGRLYKSYTFFYTPKKDLFEGYEFPDDPWLPTASPFFLKEAGNATKVLRYIPRYRITFQNKGLIGKIMQTKHIKNAYQKLVKVSDALRNEKVGFDIASAEGIDEMQSIYYQKSLPGKNINFFSTDANINDLLYRVGKINSQIHSLKIDNIPYWDQKTFLDEIKKDILLLILLSPSKKDFFQNLEWTVIKNAPINTKDDLVFCHGDFRLGHILKSAEKFLIIDFDEANYSDPYLELARLIALLKSGCPPIVRRFINPKEKSIEFLEQVAQSYLLGYQKYSKKILDKKHLLWARLCWEIHYSARILKKDLYHPVVFERNLTIIDRLEKQLSKRRVRIENFLSL